MVWHPSDISLTFLACPWKNNDTAIFNKHLSKKENCSSNWSEKTKKKKLVFDSDPLDIIKSVGFRSESPYFLGKGQKQHSLSDTNVIASRLVSKLDEQLNLQMVD